MDASTITTIIIGIILFAAVLLFPFINGATQGTLKHLEHELPANMQALLDGYAKTAVQAVEQSLKTSTGEQKKAMALEIIKDLCIAAKLPLPNMSILSAVIESAVYLLNQEQQIATPTPATSSLQK